jgi:hypothetical protein
MLRLDMVEIFDWLPAAKEVILNAHGERRGGELDELWRLTIGKPLQMTAIADFEGTAF